LVKLLESRGIAPEFEDIHVASALGRIERVKAMLSSDPDLRDKQDVLGATPLYWSVAHRKLDVAAYLLSLGADPNIKERHGRTPLLCATQRKDRQMISLLVRQGAVKE
jgi:ankyrin repeat protein